MNLSDPTVDISATRDRLTWTPRADHRPSSTRPASSSCLVAGRARLVIEMLGEGLVAHGLIHGLPTKAVDCL